MPYQYVREPLMTDEFDRLSNACVTPTERLVVWTLLDTGLRDSELCALTWKNVLWQQRQLRIKGNGGPHGKKTKVPRGADVELRAGTPGAPFRSGEGVPGQDAACPGHRQGGGQPRGDHQGSESARAAAHVRHDGLAEGDQPPDGAEDPGPRQSPDDGDLPQLYRPAHPKRVRAEVVRIGSSPGCPANWTAYACRTQPLRAWFKTPGIRVTVLALLTGVGSCSGFSQPRSGGIS